MSLETQMEFGRELSWGFLMPRLKPGGWCGQAFVSGEAASQGSKRLVTTKQGKTLMLDDDPRLKPWRTEMQYAMRQRAPETPVDTPVAVLIYVSVERPRSHYGTGRNADFLKPGAPLHPASGRDADKCARACLDAGTGVWWRDDRRVCCLIVQRVWVGYSDPCAGVRVIAWEVA